MQLSDNKEECYPKTDRHNFTLDYNQSYDFASYSTLEMLIGNTVFAYLLCAAMAEGKHME